MKKFIVSKSTDERFKNQTFSVNTQIMKMVDLPFTKEQYRCIMFDGLTIHLTNGKKEIIGTYRR